VESVFSLSENQDERHSIPFHFH